MKDTSISKKLSLSNAIGFWITFTLLSLVAILCFAGLNSSIEDLLESQMNDHVKQLIEDSKQDQTSYQKSRLKLLKEKGFNLLETGQLVLTPYLEEYSLTTLREYLKITYESDNEIGLVSFFVLEDGEVRSWQYISATNEFSINDEVRYDFNLKKWIGKNQSEYAPEVIEILKSKKITIERKRLTLNIDNKLTYVDVLDCYSPIYNQEEQTLTSLQLKNEPIGFLRYVITLEQLKLLLDARAQKLTQDIIRFKKDNTDQLTKAKLILDKVKWNALLILMLVGGAISALRGLYLNHYIKNEILDPVIRLSSSLEKVSEGDLSVSLVNANRMDEIGVMSHSIDQLVKIINSAVTEFDKQVQHTERGEFFYRGDEKIFRGAYVDLIAGGNRLIESFINHLNVIQNMIIIVNSSGQVLFANKITQQLLEVDLDGVLNNNIFDLIDWSVSKELLLDSSIIEDQEKIQIECNISIAHQSYDISATSVHVQSQAESEKTYLLVLVDQTEKQKAQSEMKDALELSETATIEMSKAQDQMIQAARLAGKADIASSVLHNVGNVLNSVNVSISVLRDKVEYSNSSRLTKVMSLLEQNIDNLEFYLTQDEKGKVLISYLSQLGDVLTQENQQLQEEVISLEKGIEHIKEIVNVQQRYTKTVFGVEEQFSIVDLVNDAIAFNFDAVQLSKVTLINHAQSNVTLSLDRHLLLQIVVNLLSNAKFSVEEARVAKPTITISCEDQGDSISLCVKDNGLGIAEDVLLKIFSYGFTTKQEGHGFGLHSSANAAQEMGGDLRAHSDGLSCGAEFYLTLPKNKV
ncbi:MAG: GHKL domain-containing protein [Candidatus Cloacimonetes bacterium]|nr:GHKL domain-containing protein [Candidatus Cloacimonadota bacterium]